MEERGKNQSLRERYVRCLLVSPDLNPSSREARVKESKRISPCKAAKTVTRPIKCC